MKVIELLSCLTFLGAITSGVEIQCFYEIGYWSDINIGTEPLYTCYVTVTNLENPAMVTDITGTHVTEKGNEDVKAFMFYDVDQMFTKIPTGIENFFANLEAFHWHGGNISEIDSSTFEPFPNLFIIVLHENKLVTLNGDLFQHTPKLRVIDLHQNLLQHVGHDLLTGLTELATAYFGNNPCIDLNGYTPQEIEELKLQLPIRCPPLATTPDPPTTTISTTPEPNECTIRCPDTCTMNEEAKKMKSRIEEIERRLSELE